MSKIRVLPDNVANQIAAGEVIERPAAVVKELLENALDSGAKRINVAFRNGGKSYIRIEDDGCGMSPDEALLCLERHATSKIRSADDLNEIATFGFRGEALPSIASVSSFTLKTREKGASIGCEVFVNGGKLVHQKDCGMAEGTRIEVANLFNSVPVRRKFLKTDNTEAAHIIYLVRLYAVSNPRVAFSLYENDRLIFKSPASTNLEERVGGIWGKKLIPDLVNIHSEENGMLLTGLIGKPGLGRSTRQELITLVNNRPVDSKLINYAILESYHTYIPKGRYPVAFLFLNVNPNWVDVNVHPAKREVRFRQEPIIRQFITRAITSCLRNTVHESIEKATSMLDERKSVTPPQKVYQPSVAKPASPVVSQGPVFIPREKSKVSVTVPQKDMVTPSVAVLEQKAVSSSPVSKTTYQKENKGNVATNWRYIGTISKRYILLESPDGLVVLNAKGAQQRILYEKIQQDFKKGAPITQPLLFPISLDLEPRISASFQENLQLFRKTGFMIEKFGRNFFKIEAIPEWLQPTKAEGFVRDLAGLIQDQNISLSKMDVLYEKIARFAIQESIQITDKFDESNVKRLLSQLLSSENPLSCPKGKPTFFETTFSELKQKFGK